MSAEDIEFNLDNPPVGMVDFNINDLYSLSDFDLLNDPVGSGMFDASGNLSTLGAETLLADPQLFEQFKTFDPEAAALLEDPEMRKLLRQQSLTQSGQNAVANVGPQGDTGVITQSADPTGLAAIKKRIADALGVEQSTLGDMAKYAAAMGIAKLARDDAEKARKEARGASFKASTPVTATRTAYKGTKYSAAGGLASLAGGGEVTNPLDYTPSFSDVSGAGLGSGFADPKVQEMLDKLDLRSGAAYKNPELDTLTNQLAQQESAIKNRFLADNVSIDQITGDIDPIQTLRNVRAYDPSTFDTTVNSLSDVPGQMNRESLGNLKTSIKDLGNLGLPYEDLMDVAQSIVEIRSNPELVGKLSNLAGDIRSITKPTDEEEELGSSYAALASLQAPKMGENVTQMRASGGGIGTLAMARGGRTLPPRYLNGHTDGMADKVPAHIDRKRPAALSDGEFVIPADVVSHLGNGNSNAGAKRLYEMMDRIRSARTGNSKQGKQINPNRFLPR